MIQKIGEMLVNEGLVTLEQLNQALEAQQQSGDLLGSILIRLGFVEESVMVEFLSKQFQLPAVDPMKLSIEKDVLDLLPTKLVQKFQVIPIAILDLSLIHI